MNAYAARRSSSGPRRRGPFPGNRAISYSPKIAYGLYEVTAAPDGQLGEEPATADPRRQARRRGDQAGARDGFEKLHATCRLTISPALVMAHPLKGFAGGYDFVVPLLAGDHVTDDAGTGFVHTAPGHGREDFDIWTANARELEARGINTTIPYTVDENGAFTDQRPASPASACSPTRARRATPTSAVIKALTDAGMLIARGRLKHQYPHSWRSKKPVIFRNTPQWFIAMDRDILGDNGNPSPATRCAIAR